MNAWFKDPRIEQAEVDAFQAERAERHGDLAAARSLYQKAGEAFACVALVVPSDHPNTRSDLAIAAVASYARAGRFDQAIELGERMLAESGALSELGRQELLRLVRDFKAVIAPAAPLPRKGTANRGASIRDEVRNRFRTKEAA